MRKGLVLNLSKGFTLLEMLVVIGLMAILISVGTVSYSTAQKKARDTKRKQDLRIISNALEQYYSLCVTYPASVVGGGSITTPGSGCSSAGTVILSVVPLDPKTNLPYVYTYNAANNTFSLCAQAPNSTMESETSPYCVNSQQ